MNCQYKEDCRLTVIKTTLYRILLIINTTRMTITINNYPLSSPYLHMVYQFRRPNLVSCLIRGTLTSFGKQSEENHRL